MKTKVYMNNETGEFYGIGVGPGDSELITVKAVRIIKSVDCIFAPRADSKSSSLALDIVKDICVDKRVIEQVYPMVRDKTKLEAAWLASAKEIEREIAAGNSVAYLTIGDPLTFSTYCYLLQQLSKIIPSQKIHTIPGITSYNAAASLANFSLIEQNENLAIIPVSSDIEELRPILNSFDTVILMKVAKKLDDVIELLEDMGLIDNALFASYIGFKNELITRDLLSLKGEGKGYLSVIIVRKPTNK
ncbi:MAG: precorrin-2 C20-methyltransferase [Candidatus Scalindua brodae]|uniref:Precorrin-2 C20-methyltransferase n=1 Tax=Candidatus Scalindua brodae TaxID=237368 RepID=A0A0B0EHX3_9BACT|nr:MAG: precorrin-2 C20-methyltransferase [Candidatus Scalindua brodae]